MPDYITVTPAQGTWVVTAAGAVIGESSAALELREGSAEPVIYFPPDDIAMAFLEPSDAQSTCPHKGTARYYHIEAKSGRIENAAWAYDDPKPNLDAIRGYLAFYPKRVTIEQI